MPAKKNIHLVTGHMGKAERAEREAREVKVDKIKKMQAPVYLPDSLKPEFSTLSQLLIKSELLSRLDQDALARYVMAQSAWSAAHEKARDALDTDDPKEAGSWAKIANTYFLQARASANDMGLTISSRCRLEVPQAPKEEEDAMSKTLRERMERRQKA